MNAGSLDLDALNALAPKLGGTRVVEARALSGGASQALWLVVLESAERPTRLVLRRAAAACGFGFVDPD